MTLDILIKEAKALELSEKHASQIENKSPKTNAMFKKTHRVGVGGEVEGWGSAGKIFATVMLHSWFHLI